MRQASAVLLDAADPKLAAEVRERIEASGDTRIHDFHIWRIGPTAHAVVLSIEGSAPRWIVRRSIAAWMACPRSAM
jgi:Co/Zn/Cd efflux system component